MVKRRGPARCEDLARMECRSSVPNKVSPSLESRNLHQGVPQFDAEIAGNARRSYGPRPAPVSGVGRSSEVFFGVVRSLKTGPRTVALRLSQNAVASGRQAGLCVYSELWHISQDSAKRVSCAGPQAPRGGVARQGVVLTDRKSLVDCQKILSRARASALFLSLWSLK
jgi:hypothetical protein